VLLHEPVRTILLDIEGTTTPLAYVHETLFPYARLHVRQFLGRHHLSESVGADLRALHQEHLADVEAAQSPPALDSKSPQSELESMVTYIEWLMARDRKSTALKSLQGKIWEEGYHSGNLLAPVFDDVPAAFERWRAQTRNIAIFSSGSILSQELLFAHTNAGDLTPFISAYFDTTTGAKTDAGSYQKIAVSLELPPGEIAFISDVTAELDAAAKPVGIQVLFCERVGNRPQPPGPYHEIQDFNGIFP
jgi:enolase-phosphatase E1